MLFSLSLIFSLTAAVAVGVAIVLGARQKVWAGATAASAVFALLGWAAVLSRAAVWRTGIYAALGVSPAKWALTPQSRPLAAAAFALPLVGLLVDAARSEASRRGMGGWAGLLALGAVGAVAASAANLVAVLLVWAFLMLAWGAAGLWRFADPLNREAAAWSGFWRSLSLLLLGGAIFWVHINALQAVRLGILAAALRLAVLLAEPYLPDVDILPWHIASVAVEGVSIASAAVLIGALAGEKPFLPGGWVVVLGLLALWGAWRWLRAIHSEAAVRGAIVALGSVGLIAAGMGLPRSAVAWFLLGIFPPVGVAFLRWRSSAALGAAALWALALAALPFTPAAPATDLLRLHHGAAFWFIPPVMALAIAALARQVALLPAERPQVESAASRLSALGSAAWLVAFYALVFLPGMGGAVATGWLIGRLVVGLAMLAFGGALAWVALRWLPEESVQAVSASAGIGRRALAGAFWTVYRWFAKTLGFFSALLEGDGGVMWALVLLVMLAVLFAR